MNIHDDNFWKLHRDEQLDLLEEAIELNMHPGKCYDQNVLPRMLKKIKKRERQFYDFYNIVYEIVDAGYKND